MFSKRYKNKNIQSHYLLADRIQSMARSLQHNIRKLTEEEQKALDDLRSQADQHRRAAWLTGDEFIMIR